MRRLFSRYPSTAKTPFFQNSKQLFIFWTRFLSECAYFCADFLTYINDFYEYGYDLILVKSNWIWPTLPFSHSPCRFSCFIRSIDVKVSMALHAQAAALHKSRSQRGKVPLTRLKSSTTNLTANLASGYLTIEASFLSPGRLEKQDARKTKISDILLKGDVMIYEIQTRLFFSDVYRPDFVKDTQVCLK